ncbi:MAG: hypothetical protein O3B00_07925 [archaeon]|nr:hypothetical protein [archaeon]MDA1131411.1 hypothetical protein [archaeon]
MEMDWKGNMAELGGAFMLSWVVLGMGGSGVGTLIGAATLAVAWMAFSGAHLLPVVTWCHMMTGDMSDTEGNWMANGMRLVFQALGALVAVLLMTEAGSLDTPTFVAPEMWVADMGSMMWPVITMMAVGAVWWQIHTRCDSEWVSALGLMALSGVGIHLDGGHMMGSMLADGGTQVADVVVDWIMNGLVVGLGALLGMKIDEMIPDGDDTSAE